MSIPRSVLRKNRLDQVQAEADAMEHVSPYTAINAKSISICGYVKPRCQSSCHGVQCTCFAGHIDPQSHRDHNLPEWVFWHDDFTPEMKPLMSREFGQWQEKWNRNVTKELQEICSDGDLLLTAPDRKTELRFKSSQWINQYKGRFLSGVLQVGNERWTVLDGRLVWRDL